jgi:SpoVK/Ycf46/Vps4 family AAA+-type ATPase
MSNERPPYVKSLLEAVERSPDDLALRLHVVRVLIDANDLTEALAQCTKALQGAPSDTDALGLLSEINERLQRSAPPGSSARRAADGEEIWEELERELQAQSAAGSGKSVDAPVDTERPTIRLDDVGGMENVKRELRESFLIPMGNPALREAYKASLGGGLLLYGPPGCGKTFLGRALAGELGASFFPISMADVLDMWIGSSERNLQAVFDVARAHRPSVIFFDEVDAIGQKRANLRSNPAMRGVVNQLLSEMDGAQGDNEGVFLLGASNQPWDVDTALRRPGRFDRMLFVPPPDLVARDAILRYHLSGPPLDTVDYAALARRTEGFSGADLARICKIATRLALADSATTGVVRPIGMRDLEQGLTQAQATTREWFTTARNVVTFSNRDGLYDDLASYMKSNKLI